MEPGSDVVKIALPASSTTGSRVPIQPTVFRRYIYEIISSFFSGSRCRTDATPSLPPASQGQLLPSPTGQRPGIHS